MCFGSNPAAMNEPCHFLCLSLSGTVRGQFIYLFFKMGVLDRHTTKIYFPIMNGKRKK